MRYLLITLAVLLIFAAPVLADQGTVSHNQMAKMGLSGMTAMSDAQGATVRGMGFVKTSVTVSGNAQVALGCGPVSNAGYSATGTCQASGSGFATTSKCVSVPDCNGCLKPVLVVVTSSFVTSTACAK